MQQERVLPVVATERKVNSLQTSHTEDQKQEPRVSRDSPAMADQQQVQEYAGMLKRMEEKCLQLSGELSSATKEHMQMNRFVDDLQAILEPKRSGTSPMSTHDVESIRKQALERVREYKRGTMYTSLNPTGPSRPTSSGGEIKGDAWVSSEIRPTPFPSTKMDDLNRDLQSTATLIEWLRTLAHDMAEIDHFKVFEGAGSVADRADKQHLKSGLGIGMDKGCKVVGGPAVNQHDVVGAVVELQVARGGNRYKVQLIRADLDHLADTRDMIEGLEHLRTNLGSMGDASASVDRLGSTVEHLITIFDKILRWMESTDRRTRFNLGILQEQERRRLSEFQQGMKTLHSQSKAFGEVAVQSIQSLEASLEEERARTDALAVLCKSLKAEHEGLMDQLTMADETRRETSNTLSNAQAEGKSLSTRIADLQQAVKDLHQKLEASDAAKKGIEIQLDRLKNEHVSMFADFDNLSREHKLHLAEAARSRESEREKEREREREKEREAERRAADEKEIHRLREIMKSNQEEIMMLTNYLEAAKIAGEEAATKIESLLAKLRVTETEKEDLWLKFSVLLVDHNSMVKDFDQQVQDLRKNLDASGAVNRSLDHEKNGIEFQLDSLSKEYNRERERAEDKRATDEKEIQRLRGEIMVLAKELAAATEAGTVAAGEIGSLLTTVEVKEAEREELRLKFSSLLEDKDKQLNEFRERYHDLRENIQTVRRSNETTVAEVIAELKTAEAEANLLRSRIRELEQTQRSMENTLAAEASNLMALQDENGTLKLKITALQDEIGARQLKIEQQERDIGIKNCRIEDLSDDMKRLENDMRSELQTTSDSWRMKCNNLQQDLEKESATLQGALQREKELQDALKRELAVFLFLSFSILGWGCTKS